MRVIAVYFAAAWLLPSVALAEMDQRLNPNCKQSPHSLICLGYDDATARRMIADEDRRIAEQQKEMEQKAAAAESERKRQAEAARIDKQRRERQAEENQKAREIAAAKERSERRVLLFSRIDAMKLSEERRQRLRGGGIWIGMTKEAAEIAVELSGLGLPRQRQMILDKEGQREIWHYAPGNTFTFENDKLAQMQSTR